MYRRSNWWTSEADALLMAMIDEGKTPDEIAAEFGKSRNAIIGRAWRLGCNNWSRPKAAAPRNKSRHKSRKKAEQLRAELHEIGMKEMKKPNQALVRLREELAKPFVEVPQDALKLLIWDLEDHHCRWIVEGTGDQARFCGCNRPMKEAYCPTHRQMAWQVLRRRATG